MKIICPYCQNSFIPKRIDAVYCCPSHKQMAYKVRKMNLSVNLKSMHELQLSKNDTEPSTKYLNENEEALAKSIYPSTDGSQQNQYPSIKENAINYMSTKIIYPSTKKNLEDENPSTKMIYPSTEVSGQSQKPSTNYPSIDALNVNNNAGRDLEAQYKHYKSPFVDALIELTDERDNISKLSPLFWNDATGIYLWVSTRFKCLAECLLTFSEMKTIKVDDLKEICNAFTLLIRSNYFKSLQNYPYANEILELRESLKKICQSADENETLKFRLLPQNKKELIATRWELHYYAPKVNFSELSFKE
ncbi:MAG: hypothetical protein H0U95_04400 [Bacteroidetes bacterium]|nr:hypothetical protein [Bacteroidota bacterium]